jgi:hypothetical protein
MVVRALVAYSSRRGVVAI